MVAPLVKSGELMGEEIQSLRRREDDDFCWGLLHRLVGSVGRSASSLGLSRVSGSRVWLAWRLRRIGGAAVLRTRQRVRLR